VACCLFSEIALDRGIRLITPVGPTRTRIYVFQLGPSLSIRSVGLAPTSPPSPGIHGFFVEHCNRST
jgi:hypothetical protein